MTTMAPLTLSDARRRAEHNSASRARYLEVSDDVGRLLLRRDWSSTPLGPIEHWPQRLHEVLKLCLNSNFPYIVYWGPQLLTFWNSAGSVFFGGQHPHALGQPLHEIQSDAAKVLAPRIAQVLRNGLAVLFEDMQLLYCRQDYEEEFYETFSYSPILNDEGQVAGVITPIIDTTAHVIGVRRLRLLGELASRTRSVHVLRHYCETLASSVASNPYDVPFFALYGSLPDGSMQLLAHAGVTEDPHGVSGLPSQVGMETSALASALRQPQLSVLAASSVLAQVPAGAWNNPPRSVAVLPVRLHAASERRFAVVAALNPYKRLDRDYRDFLGLLTDQIGRGLADCRAYEEAADRSRAELAVLMRRATMGELATSIAHEVNQPLAAVTLDAHACLRWLGAAPPNLDEARAAAGRIVASGRHAGNVVRRIRSFLAGTAPERRLIDPIECVWSSLAMVRSEARRHDIALRVRFGSGLPPVLADPTQLRQVLLNLLLNAIEATQALPDRRGCICTELRADAEGLQLLVHDNGGGIDVADASRWFEAFYSTKTDGLGFGLALCRSILEAHGGHIGAFARQPHGVTLACWLPAAQESPCNQDKGKSHATQ